MRWRRGGMAGGGLRVAEVADSSIGNLLFDGSAEVADVAPWNAGANQIVDPAPLEFVTFSGFELRLAPATTYAFEVIVPSGYDIGWELNRTDGDLFAGGEAFTDGDNGRFTGAMAYLAGLDRVFHLDLTEGTEAPPSSE